MVITLAGCAGTDQATTHSARARPSVASTIPLSAGEGAAIGPGLSIAEARRGNLKGPVLVNGYLLLVNGHSPRLCTALSANEPPRCLAPSLTVARIGRNQRTLATQKAGKTRWSPAPIQILGRLNRSVLSGETTATA